MLRAAHAARNGPCRRNAQRSPVDFERRALTRLELCVQYADGIIAGFDTSPATSAALALTHHASRSLFSVLEWACALAGTKKPLIGELAV